MHLDRLLDDPQLAGDLLVQTTEHDEIEDLALAWGQRAEPSSKVGDTSPVAVFSSVFLHRPTHGIEHVTRPIRLREEIYRTRAYRADAHRDVAVRGDEHDGHALIALREQVLQIEAGEARHLDVENQTGGAILRWVIEKLVARGEGHDPVPCRAQQPRQALADRGVVVDDVDGGRRRSHPPCPSMMGRLNVKVAPLAVVLSTQRCPPWASISDWAIDNPIPRPDAFVV